MGEERSAGEGVVADAVAADPGIEQRKGEQKKQEQETLRCARAGPERRMNAMLFHERGTRQTLPLSVASHDVQAGKHCPNGIVHYSGWCSIAARSGGLLPATPRELAHWVALLRSSRRCDIPCELPLERLPEGKIMSSGDLGVV